MKFNPIDLLIAAFALVCSGCGVVWLPSIEVCPNPVKTVRVCDQATGSVISHSEVAWRVLPHEYKGYPWDGGRFYAPANLVSPDIGMGGAKTMRGRRLNDGEFRLNAKTLLAGWQWLWPLWSWATYGDFEYHGHATEIVASAVGYHPARILFATDLLPSAFRTHAKCTSDFLLSDDGVLTIFLQSAPPAVATSRLERGRSGVSAASSSIRRSANSGQKSVSTTFVLEE